MVPMQPSNFFLARKLITIIQVFMLSFINDDMNNN